MKPGMSDRPLRSVLYVPASNERALGKIASLGCDAVIIDLEDAVVPEVKAAARETMRRFVAGRARDPRQMIVRINALSSDWGADDLSAAIEAGPDAILLPKVETPRDILEADEAVDEAGGDTIALWAMIENPRALLNIGAIAELGRTPAPRLACLVAGTNDLVKETGIQMTADRRHLSAWLMQLVLGAKAGNLAVLDGVSNDFRDLEAFGRECAEGAAMGFDGKTLIHPGQIDAANRAFSPSQGAIAEAEAIVAAFALAENAGKGAISLDGRMVERLHLAQAERLLAKAGNSGDKQP
jgi:citrate lyase subunit beta/citryl-CoA lyase